MTCDETFVLVTSEASREWAYTALSRGRRSNRLYAVEHELDERPEYAPEVPCRRDELAVALARSDANRPAIEVRELGSGR